MIEIVILAVNFEALIVFLLHDPLLDPTCDSKHSSGSAGGGQCEYAKKMKEAASRKRNDGGKAKARIPGSKAVKFGTSSYYADNSLLSKGVK